MIALNSARNQLIASETLAVSFTCSARRDAEVNLPNLPDTFRMMPLVVELLELVDGFIVSMNRDHCFRAMSRNSSLPTSIELPGGIDMPLCVSKLPHRVANKIFKI